MIIGLTGSIGSGKSTAARRLAEFGARVLDADAVSRMLTAPGGAAIPAIEATFGRGVFHESGALDRRALAEIVFADEGKRKALNSIVHPLVLEFFLEKSNEISAADPNAVIVWDVPLLIEAGWQDLCDEVWLVTAPAEARVSRVAGRDGNAGEEALRRISAQMGDGEKARYADVVFHNDGEIALFLAQVDLQYQRVSERAR